MLHIFWHALIWTDVHWSALLLLPLGSSCVQPCLQPQPAGSHNQGPPNRRDVTGTGVGAWLFMTSYFLGVTSTPPSPPHFMLNLACPPSPLVIHTNQFPYPTPSPFPPLSSKFIICRALPSFVCHTFDLNNLKSRLGETTQLWTCAVSSTNKFFFKPGFQNPKPFFNIPKKGFLSFVI